MIDLPVLSIGSWFAQTALDGSLLLAIPVALVAGTVSFFSPCVVPLLPGYMSYVTGLSGADIAANGSTGVRGRMVVGTLLFILGFSVVFVSYGAIFGELGYQFLSNRDVITKVLGALTIVLGLAFAGVVPWLRRDVRVHRVPAVGLAAAPFLGVLFGFGWTPCIGPTLAAVLSLSASTASAGRGAFLTFVYCLGLGIPFIVAAVAFRRMAGAVDWVRRHQVWVMRLGGAMLVVVGILLLSGVWDWFIVSMKGWVTGFETAV
ncbi:MAG: cytochrome c biogenesis protein CcdA [Nocardioidaceae bacterium]|nr:cytochrome c biogenesis protein CcdA [Nocardioidaceae bacterium]